MHNVFYDRVPNPQVTAHYRAMNCSVLGCGSGMRACAGVYPHLRKQWACMCMLHFHEQRARLPTADANGAVRVHLPANRAEHLLSLAPAVRKAGKGGELCCMIQLGLE